MTNKPPGRLARLASLGGLTGRVTTAYVADRVRSALTGSELAQTARDRLHLDSARDIVETMSKLKGAAMKVGQQVAMLADGLDLPPEVGQLLGTLHAQAEPIPFTQIKEDVESSLERPLDVAFASFDPKPLGTASLAQAHRATLPDGREVVVKVLHRGVETSVDTDLMALKGILISSRVMRRGKEEMDDIFDELRDRLTEELDYLHEALNLNAYQQVYGDDPRVRIPVVYPEWSTERVLTLDRLPGQHIDTFLRYATPEARARAGHTIAHFYYEQVFRHRMLHADPHPGNYLFEADGRVGVLDFGCVKRFDEFWIAEYARVALHVVAGEREGALQGAIKIGAWDGLDPAAGEALWRFMSAIGKGFASGEVELGAANEHLLEDMRPVITELIRHPSIRAPKHVIMLHRSLGGLYAMGRKLGARMDFGALLRQHAQYAIDRAEGRNPAT
jgi:predicted unusual protein kinase regulating ubiquinone biosynthesis (AarF/ABC1/UbiB family)